MEREHSRTQVSGLLALISVEQKLLPRVNWSNLTRQQVKIRPHYCCGYQEASATSTIAVCILTNRKCLPHINLTVVPKVNILNPVLLLIYIN